MQGQVQRGGGGPSSTRSRAQGPTPHPALCASLTPGFCILHLDFDRPPRGAGRPSPRFCKALRGSNTGNHLPTHPQFRPPAPVLHRALYQSLHPLGEPLRFAIQGEQKCSLPHQGERRAAAPGMAPPGTAAARRSPPGEIAAEGFELGLQR